MPLSEIDRSLQGRILTLLSECYPNSPSEECISELDNLASREKLISNLLYLEEYGLLISGVTQTFTGEFFWERCSMRITSRGIDLLKNDGGPIAIIRRS